MRSLAHEIHGLPVHATDGEIGSVKDVVFETSNWRIHFIEVDTGWLFGRNVLVPAEKIVRVELPEKGIFFDLTEQAIKDSPPADSARPEDRYYDTLFPYFGLSAPWVIDPAPQPEPIPEAAPVDAARRLIFARDLDGFDLYARDEPIGTVRDVMIDLERRKVISISADLGGLIQEDVAEVRIGPVVEVDVDRKLVRVNVDRTKLETEHRLSPEDLPYVLPYIPPIM